MYGNKSEGNITVDVRDNNTFMHLEPIIPGQNENVEMPIVMYFRVFN